MKGAPFSAVAIFREQCFGLLPDPPCLQSFAMSKILLHHVPGDGSATIGAHPLSVDIHINVNSKVS